MSYNFNPQPNFRSPGNLSTISMHAPTPPTIRIPLPTFDLRDYATQYHQGAVRIEQTNFLEGDTGNNGNFSNFVCSFWATNLFIPTGAGNFNDFAVFISPTGSYDLNTNLGPTGNVPYLIRDFMIRLEANGAIGLFFLDSTSTGLLGSWHGPPDTLGVDTSTSNPILPLGVWHHYIVSFEGSTNRCQIACDRGGGPSWGGGVMDTNLGNFGFQPVTFHPGNAPQGIWGGFTVGNPTSFTNPPNLDWRIQAPNSSSIDLAYFYFGISGSFFDLTAPGNLDFFVTSSLTPVNLGPKGSFVTPLTCLIMHTGNAVDPIFTDPNHPVFQFPYNAVTARLWGGTISDAPTQPPVGA